MKLFNQTQMNASIEAQELSLECIIGKISTAPGFEPGTARLPLTLYSH